MTAKHFDPARCKPIYKVAILGGGTMGADLAALMVRQNMPTVVKEVNSELASQVLGRLWDRIDDRQKRGKIGESDAVRMKMLLSATSAYTDLQDVDLVIEAVPENLELKQKVFVELEEKLPAGVIFASNTSSLPIKLLSARMKDPSRLAGMHFFNPPTKMPLIELVSSDATAEEVTESLDAFARETLLKTPIRVKDQPGFLMNVLLGAYLAPAIQALEETTLTPEEIDAEAKVFDWPAGPFFLLDMLGVDVTKEVMRVLHDAYGGRFTTSRLVDCLVAAGRLGAKTGNNGFYDGAGVRETLQEILTGEFPGRVEASAKDIFRRMMAALANEAARALEEGVASANDIETGCLLGLGFPQAVGGPLHFADKIGAAALVGELGDKACALLREKALKNEKFFESW